MHRKKTYKFKAKLWHYDPVKRDSKHNNFPDIPATFISGVLMINERELLKFLMLVLSVVRRKSKKFISSVKITVQ